MASETSIANAALTHLGERRINSMEDSSKTAKLLKERYAEIRDETLRAHTWNFATKRTGIAKDAAAPAWGYDSSFTLPVDCLRLINLDNPQNYPYTVEGRKILIDLGGPINIEYTAQVTDPNEMDALFRGVLAAALAMDVAEAITGTNTKVEQLTSIYRDKLRMARTPDGQEPKPPFVQASEWLDAREEAGAIRQVGNDTAIPL